MGKSSVLKSQAFLTESSESAEDLRVDLASFSSESRLIRKILEGPEVKRWKDGEGVLCLTLDSFDEAHSRIDNLHRLLGDYLDEWACERLFLRVFCRTAQWPTSMTEILRKRMGEVESYELLPLRRSDAAAIVSPDLNANEFLDAVETALVVPLAARPLTLKLLSANYKQSNTLPDRTTELYETGLLTLCDEMNAERRDANAIPDPERLLQTAGRLATFSILGGRPTVWTGPAAEATPADLTVGDCITSGAGAQHAAITSELVLDTLHTGIFTGAGPQRLSWSHATFTDFLAARWMVQSGLNADQFRSILISPDGKLHPRVHQLAAWLLALQPTGFSWLVTVDPEAFLRGVEIPTADLRAQVVAELLAEAARGSFYHNYTHRFDGLKHDSLADQLRVALSSLNGEERRIAIDIARQCNERALSPDLAAIALNDNADINLRISAAMAVRILAEDSPTDALVPLLNFRVAVDGCTDQDQEQELEAVALMASWPHAFSTAEVFDRLDPRQPRNFVGLFSSFVRFFAQSLTDGDLESACHWITSTGAWTDDSRITELIDAILCMAIKHLDKPAAAAAAVRIGLERVDNYEPIYTHCPNIEIIPPSVEECRALVLALLTEASEEQAFGMTHSGMVDSGLLSANDFVWLIDQYAVSEGVLRANLAKVIGWTFSPTDRVHIDAVLGLGDGDPAVILFAHWRDSVLLGSPAAEAGRDGVRIQHEYMANRRNRRENPDKWVNPRIAELAEKALDGDIDAFWLSCRLITVRPGTEHYMDEFQPDLSGHPRWNTLTEQTRTNLTASAAIYLRNGDCSPERWLLSETRYYPAEAGYRALLLLLRNRPHELGSFDSDIWNNWAPILISWGVSLNGARSADKKILFQFAIPHAREQLTNVLLQLIDVAIAAGSRTFRSEELALLQSKLLSDQLIKRLEGGICLASQTDILDSVLSFHPEIARPLLLEWLQPLNRETEPERARDAAVRLLQIADLPWSTFRELMSTDPEFMKGVFLAGSQIYERRPPSISEKEIGDLYGWLILHFPPEDDPQHDGVYAVGPRDSLGSWRDSLLNHLTHLGTVESVSAIATLAEELPNREFLKRALTTAQRVSRENSWEPVTFQQLDELASEPTARLVRSEADLFAATLAAFDEIQKRLIGDTPTSPLLWDTYSSRPKSEDEVSDFLRNELQTFLRVRGAIINREVQVRRIKKSGMPERTDLRVEAITPAGRSIPGEIVVIIGEVKGCWNKDIETSIQSQLVERYMADLHTSVGIYIAVWFDLDSWTITDRRRRNAAKYATAEGLRKVLEAKAADQKRAGNNVAVVVLDASLGRVASK
ncbi:NACHT domain-containing protein [Rhodococcus erythropolis]|uniref:NACHT domain-containing protein n=1 Tax=Rhodococcus TaxID=1827 RepID=UPI001562A6FE|nr:hypothetical protein [Rhodococcus sp. MS13]NRH34418.1 hypothetical protein [Rhodococcus sp. MS13]